MFKSLIKLFKIIRCRVRGHHYRPVYEYSFRYKVGQRKMRKIDQTFTYHCAECGESITMRGSQAHDRFKREQCPTWGERGSDSQGYRGGLPEPCDCEDFCTCHQCR